MASSSSMNEGNGSPVSDLVMGEGATLLQRLAGFLGRSVLLGVTSVSALAVLFIFVFIIREALPFFKMGDVVQFFTSTDYYPTQSPPEFGALAIILGSVYVTLGAVLIATPLGVAAALSLSDVVPFSVRQFVKPIIEILAAIPSVAYGFFAAVIFAPLLQEQGGAILTIVLWIVGLPLMLIGSIVFGDLVAAAFSRGADEKARKTARFALSAFLAVLSAGLLFNLGQRLSGLEIQSGTNILNASLILALMALPTVVSVSEDALTAVGRELREGSYALGATRAETLVKVVLPAARSGILAAILLGVMRAVGETMVVWMAAGNAIKLPEPFYNYLTPLRTLTATIAGDMGETANGSAHYHALFLMALLLLAFSFLCNLASEWSVRRARRKLG